MKVLAVLSGVRRGKTGVNPAVRLYLQTHGLSGGIDRLDLKASLSASGSPLNFYLSQQGPSPPFSISLICPKTPAGSLQHIGKMRPQPF